MRESDFVVDYYDEPAPEDWEPDEIDPFTFFHGSVGVYDPRQAPKADSPEVFTDDNPPF